MYLLLGKRILSGEAKRHCVEVQPWVHDPAWLMSMASEQKEGARLFLHVRYGREAPKNSAESMSSSFV